LSISWILTYAFTSGFPYLSLLLAAWPIAILWTLVLTASSLAQRSVVAAEIQAEQIVDGKTAFDFCKEQYEELVSTYRYLGTMRARIAWTPATLTVGVVAVFIKGGGNGNLPSREATALFVIMIVVLALIYAADSYFLREQRILGRMSSDCEILWPA
jgi:hypothetical protein